MFSATAPKHYQRNERFGEEVLVVSKFVGESSSFALQEQFVLIIGVSSSGIVNFFKFPKWRVTTD